jgi:hypothetical protein
MRTDIGDCGGHSDFNAGVAFLRQLALEEFVQLSIEDTIGDELAALGDGALCSSHDCRFCKFRSCQLSRGHHANYWTDNGTCSQLRLRQKGFDKI